MSILEFADRKGILNKAEYLKISSWAVWMSAKDFFHFPVGLPSPLLLNSFQNNLYFKGYFISFQKT